MAATSAPSTLSTTLLIHGEHAEASSGEVIAIVNPATEEELARVSSAGEADVDRAVRSARQTFESEAWRGLSARRRGALLTRLGELCLERKDELARLETLENGKPIFESHIDLRLTADTFKYYGGWADKIHGDTIPVDGQFLNYTLREPLGVIGAIVPWNFPMSLAAWKLGPALACGNTVVLKPAEQTPLTAIRLAELALEAGFPAGAVNCVPGAGPVAGAALVRHPDVDKIAFTGSTAVGKQVMREAAGTVKKVSLELGGKSPNIVFADADLDAAAKGALTGIFYGKGEVCAAGSRLLVEASAREELERRILERARKMVAGDPLDPKTRLGAIVSRAQMERVLGYITRGKEEGARLLAGGERTPVNGRGYFVAPTIFGDVRPEMTIAREEIFGPVLAMLTFDDGVDGAAALANSTIYGLAAGIWTRDIKKALRTARAVKAGTVWINTYNMYDAASPFGGFKQSGFGRDLGAQALDGYLQTKSVWVDLS
ncbi:MAG TPA: aldehyde dehydrogenase family protein [Gemmatimonadaceae bacterium]|nr:aldehyde dehydrogenase family protein [Gemmatimonadaceae bacterium]